MLNLTAIADQVADAARREGERRDRAAAEADQAAAIAASLDTVTWGNRLQARVLAARTSWLAAHSASDETPGAIFPEPPLPSDS